MKGRGCIQRPFSDQRFLHLEFNCFPLEGGLELFSSGMVNRFAKFFFEVHAMTWQRKWAICVAGVLVFLLTGVGNAGDSPLIKKEAPEVEAAFNLKGKELKLSHYKGKVVLMDFWAVWCGPCIQAFPALNELQKEFGSQGFTVVGVTSYQERFGFDPKSGKLSSVGEIVKDEDGKVTIKGGLDAMQEHAMLKDFAGYHKLSYPIIVQSKEKWRTSSKEYGIRGIPTLVLVDRLGVVRHVQVGFNPKLEEQLGERIRELVKEK